MKKAVLALMIAGVFVGCNEIKAGSETDKTTKSEKLKNSYNLPFQNSVSRELRATP